LRVPEDSRPVILFSSGKPNPSILPEKTEKLRNPLFSRKQKRPPSFSMILEHCFKSAGSTCEADPAARKQKRKCKPPRKNASERERDREPRKR
jgi:hypothetical protein